MGSREFINKIKKVFYTSRLGELYFRYLLWKDKKNAKSVNYNVPRQTISRQKILYTEGINKIKKRINSKINFTSKEEYDKVLNTIEDLMPLAENEEQKEYVEALKKAYLYKDKDIKNDTDLAKMIEKRIQHFKELHKHKESREKIRAERKAKKVE